MSADQSTILLVEDEPLVRLFVSDLLQDADFKVVEASNAAEARVILEAGLPVSVLLTDVEMPGTWNGYELAHWVHESWPGIQILVTSGRQWPEEGDLPPGAAFLAKPCPNDAIVSHVQSAAERTREGSRRTDRGTSYGTAKILHFPRTA